MVEIEHKISNLFGHGSELGWHDEDIRAQAFQLPVLGVAQIILFICNDIHTYIYYQVIWKSFSL
jgi:hypothetical protein